jgi:hypothetical protein
MTEPNTPDHSWFAVRCVIHHQGLGAYEERITLWQAADFDKAIARAERDAREYITDLPLAECVGLARAYHLPHQPGDGAEIFSLIRQPSTAKRLPPSDYLNTFFDTGTEREQIQ